jgi:predicted nucleic acid-binding protein
VKYVLDASVALKWVLPEPDSPQAIALRDAYTNQVHQLHAPDIFSVEIAYALAKVYHRGLLTQAEATQSLADILRVSPTLHPAAPLLARAFELATAQRVSLYDCVYVALAEQQQCQLVTADQRLINSLPSQSSLILELAAVP